MYRDCLYTQVVSEGLCPRTRRRHQELSRLADQTIEFLWQSTLVHLRAGLPAKQKNSGAVQQRTMDEKGGNEDKH
ncbi:hypothetical protein HPB52_002264 [Rhipicephalus sanguineus]|uniref:Uncharacterized protein n=1 Tax=Rhipicephalus sanguineus TaxID=34632 RepID=A0A9D4PIL0_RHISA|nr:hypothetical protein HPB52_002264 [Rhipicephalus sanguineus]